MIKYIFLDVDGVMNHEVWYLSEQFKVLSRLNTKPLNNDNYHKSQFCPFTVQLLNHLIDATGAKIVVSSTWRMGRTVEELQELFQNVGITGEVIGKTRVLNYAGDESNGSVPRGCEIRAWLHEFAPSRDEYRYVIFDDDADMLICQQGNFLQTDPYCGLTPQLIEKARAILGVEKK